jgi:hypothetical protein
MKEHRYYLLPGMGRGNRRWHRRIRFWAILVGLASSALVAGLLYLLDKR